MSFTGSEDTVVTWPLLEKPLLFNMAAPVKFLVMTLCLLGVMRRSAHAWMTDYDLPFVFECPTFQSLSYMKSIHSNKYEDRVWDFGCSALPLTVDNPSSYSCQWSDYVNSFDGEMNYQCPGNGFIAGVFSYHEDKYEDRRFKIYCCSFQELIPYSCTSTDWLNDFDGELNYKVPSSMVLRGVSSYHNNHYEDRRLQVQVCNIRRAK